MVLRARTDVVLARLTQELGILRSAYEVTRDPIALAGKPQDEEGSIEGGIDSTFAAQGIHQGKSEYGVVVKRGEKGEEPDNARIQGAAEVIGWFGRGLKRRRR